MPQISRQQTNRSLLILIAVLLAANLVVKALSNVSVSHAMEPVTAANGIPDSGAQIDAVRDEVRGVNKRLDTMEAYLESGSLTVKAKIEKEDKDEK